jgi:hypothetical protein
MEYEPSVSGDSIFSPHLHNVGEFNRPIECNDDMLSDLYNGLSCCDTTLSSVILSPPNGEEVLIPCGSCVIVDMDSQDTIELPDGLRIEGMLYFPPSANVSIRTTHVFVVGTLKIDTPYSGNQVKFSLYGEDDAVYTNTAGYSSLAQCPSSCNFGPKAIAVIGGRLEIQGEGKDPSCPAWEKLLAVSGSAVPIQETGQDDSINQLLVSPEAANCWGPGTELLLTSHTRSNSDRQVVTVESVDIEMRIIMLTSNINKPVTLLDHDDFAVEVASLTRPVVIEAE